MDSTIDKQLLFLYGENFFLFYKNPKSFLVASKDARKTKFNF